MIYTTVQVDKHIVEELNNIKSHSRETHKETIEKLLKFYNDNKLSYDKFLNEIQKQKMKELWDNKYDEVWENV